MLITKPNCNLIEEREQPKAAHCDKVEAHAHHETGLKRARLNTVIAHSTKWRRMLITKPAGKQQDQEAAHSTMWRRMLSTKPD